MAADNQTYKVKKGALYSDSSKEEVHKPTPYFNSTAVDHMNPA